MTTGKAMKREGAEPVEDLVVTQAFEYEAILNALNGGA